MDKFFVATSISQRGTLANIREKYGHRNVKKKVNDCVNHVVDMLRMETGGMVCLAAMKVTGLSDREAIPEGCPTKESPTQERAEFISKIAEKILDEIWPGIDQANINRCAADASPSGPMIEEDGDDESDFCICYPEDG